MRLGEAENDPFRHLYFEKDMNNDVESNNINLSVESLYRRSDSVEEDFLCLK